LNDAYSSYHDLWEQDLREVDPDVADLIDQEQKRQARKLIFIPSESFCIQPLREALSSTFTNIYAEGYPGARMSDETVEQLLDEPRQLADYRRNADRRFYKGTEYVNVLETLTQKRVAAALENERVDAEDLHVNVQPLSGANANNAIYEVFVPHGDTVMGMDLAHGGHLSHGSPFNRTGKQWNIVSYRVDEDTEQLDYNRIMDKALEHEPEMIIGGFTSYPWSPDWEKFREIADACGALLLADIAHTAGLVMGEAHPSPIGLADIVNFTTHKTAFGPRGAVSITDDPDLARKIRYSVFPGEQGGPHTNKFAAMATAFKFAQTDTFQQIQQDTVRNARALANALDEQGLRVPYGGTDTHLLLIDVSAAHPDAEWELWGEPVVRVMDLIGLVANKNTIPGDKSAADARGVRLGTPWLTQRGLDTDDMATIGELIARLVHNMEPVQYTNGRGTTPHGRVDLDLLRALAEDVKPLTEKAYAEGDPGEKGNERDARRGYPLEAYLDEPGCPHDAVTEHTGCLSLSGDAQADDAQRKRYDPPEPGPGPDDEIKQARNGSVLIHRGAGSAIRVRDRHAEPLLQEATSRNVYSVEPGEGHVCHLYDGEGTLIDEIDLYRISRKQFVLLTSPTRFQNVLSWLRGLSDGYTTFDPEDPQRNVRGPAVVQNLYETDERIALDVIGPDADTVLPDSISSRSLSPGECGLPEENSGVPQVYVHDTKERPHYTLLLPEDRAVETWTSVLSRGAVPAGHRTMRALREQAERIPIEPDAPRSAADALRIGPDRSVDLTKPYFIGQSVLENEGTPDVDRAAEPEWTEPDEPRRTPLYDEHKNRGAKMTEFGGWEMPVQYDDGILEEHRAVRTSAGLFDVGHMGILQVTGSSASRFLDLVTTNDVASLSSGRAQYAFLLTPDAEVLDDLLLYRLDENDFFLVVNAGNQDRVRAWLEAVNDGDVVIDRDRPHVTRPGTVTIRDLKTPEGTHEGRMDLALQGPESFSILSNWIDDSELIHHIDRMERFEFLQSTIRGSGVLISRTGYTGEDVGYELYVPPDDAPRIWNELLDAGASNGLRPAGLGARDSLRVEAGLPLHGHDLDGDRSISPFGAGYGGFVKWQKCFFVGRQALRRKETDRDRSIVRFKTTENGRPVREKDVVLDPESGTCVGVVTSTLVQKGTQVGLAYVKRSFTKTETDLALLSSRRIEQDQIDPGTSLNNHLDDTRSAQVLPRFMKGSSTLNWERDSDS